MIKRKRNLKRLNLKINKNHENNDNRKPYDKEDNEIPVSHRQMKKAKKEYLNAVTKYAAYVEDYPEAFLALDKTADPVNAANITLAAAFHKSELGLPTYVPPKTRQSFLLLVHSHKDLFPSFTGIKLDKENNKEMTESKPIKQINAQMYSLKLAFTHKPVQNRQAIAKDLSYLHDIDYESKDIQEPNSPLLKPVETKIIKENPKSKREVREKKRHQELEEKKERKRSDQRKEDKKLKDKIVKVRKGSDDLSVTSKRNNYISSDEEKENLDYVDDFWGFNGKEKEDSDYDVDDSCAEYAKIIEKQKEKDMLKSSNIKTDYIKKDQFMELHNPKESVLKQIRYIPEFTDFNPKSTVKLSRHFDRFCYDNFVFDITDKDLARIMRSRYMYQEVVDVLFKRSHGEVFGSYTDYYYSTSVVILDECIRHVFEYKSSKLKYEPENMREI